MQWYTHTYIQYIRPHPLRDRAAHQLQVVFGSTHPWYEAILIAMAAGHVTVVEYNRLTYPHPNITTITPSLLLQSPSKFHTALSISRFSLPLEYSYTSL